MAHDEPFGDYYVPILSDGHRLVASRKNEGAVSGNSFDDSGALGRVDWRPVGKDEVHSPSKADTVRNVTVGVVMGVVVTSVAIKAAPRIKSRWNDLKAKRNRNSEASEADGRAATTEMADLSSTAPVDFPKEVDVTLEDFSVSMDSAEVQRRLIAILVAAAFIADQMRALSNARTEDDGASLDLKSTMEKLTAPNIVGGMNRMLAANSSLLDEETSAEIMKLFGGGRFVDGQYVPLRNAKIKDVLRLTDGEF
ncbi:hypothetical protein GCM10022254_16530 [Actinomadura meridiana]|uniref:Uncharacterized protein n=1 Tax=Actinomadura meridiana TaxID=559626 RepID=A0ABP8BVU0_9ACTN